MGAQSGDYEQADVASGDDERHPENLGGALARAMGMDVHVNSLRMAGAGFKIAVGVGSKRLRHLSTRRKVALLPELSRSRRTKGSAGTYSSPGFQDYNFLH